MTQKLLDGSDVVAVFKQMRRKRMAKRVRARRLANPGFLHCVFHRLLQDRFVQMVPVLLSGNPVDIITGRWKHPLPRPLFPCVWVFALKRVRQRHAAQATFEVAPVLLP